MRMEEYLCAVTDQIRCTRARSMVEEELREHIRDQAEAYEADGMFEEEALEKAVQDMGDPVETGVSLDRIHRPRMSWGILGLAALLGLAGVVFQAALYAGGESADEAQYWLNGHVRYTLLGLVLMLAVYRLDYSILAGRARQIMGVYLALIFLGTSRLGIDMAGAGRWIDLGIIHPSAASFLYLCIPLYGAVLYDYRGIGYRKLWKLLLWALVPIWTARHIPSMVTTVVWFAASALLFSTAVWHGWYQVNRKRTLAVFWTGIIAGIPALMGIRLALGGFAEYQIERILAFLRQASEVNYVADMAQRFLASSSLVGSGFAGTAGLWERLPGFNSEYAFVSLITTYGILAGVLAAALIAYLIFRIFRISLRQRNQLGMILGCASGLVFLVQSAMHILVNLNLMPAVAVTLPFFSVGGSQLVVSYILLGLVLSVYRYKDILPEKYPEKKARQTA